MWVRLFVGLSMYEAVIQYLLQADIVSDGLVSRILEQYPPLAVVLVVVYWMRRTQREDVKETNDRLEKMLEIQRLSLKEIYQSQQTFLASLISEIEKRQAKMFEQVEMLGQQVRLNTSTVSEIAKVDSIVSELIARLEKK